VYLPNGQPFQKSSPLNKEAL